MSKFTGVLKMAGLTLLLCGGTIFNIIGVPLIFAGTSNINRAEEEFKQSQVYLEAKEREEQKRVELQEKLDEVVVSYENGELSAMEYDFLKKGYESELIDSKQNFFYNAFWDMADDRLKGMVKSGEGMQIAGGVSAVIGDSIFLLKGISFVTCSIFERSPSEVVTEFSVSEMKDVIRYDFEPDYEKRKRRQEKKEAKKKAKEEEREKRFYDDEEESLQNIEDIYYKE